MGEKIPCARAQGILAKPPGILDLLATLFPVGPKSEKFPAIFPAAGNSAAL
jgi:hypothetical protein